MSTSNIWQCIVCTATITRPDSAALTSAQAIHTRDCHNTAVVEYVNGTFTLSRTTSTKKFVCICSEKVECHEYQLASSLRRHVKQTGCSYLGERNEREPEELNEREPEELNEKESDEGPSEPAASQSSGSQANTQAAAQQSSLVHPPYLSQLGLAINKAMKLVICLPCRISLVPVDIPGHIRNQHKECRITLDPESLHKALGKFQLVNDLSRIPCEPRLEVEGLEVHDALQCGVSGCPKVMKELSSMLKHHQQEHRTVAGPSEWKAVKAQQLHRQCFTSFFPITLRHPPVISEADKVINDLYAERSATHQECRGHRLDPRLVSPWLTSTRWHELIGKHPIHELRLTASLPAVEEFPHLTESVHALFSEAEYLFDVMPELVLQRLHTADPLKTGISNMPFHRHQDHSSRMRAYCVEVIKLIAMLLRDSGIPTKYELPQEAISSLERIQAEDGRMTENILKLLVALWTVTWTKTREIHFPDPTVNMLALAMLEADGSFKEPKLTTGPIAHLEYCMRFIFMIEIDRRANLPGSLGVKGETAALEQWFTEKEDSTFNSLRSLQHRASAIAQATTSLGQIYWLDQKTYQTMLYNGHKLHFSAIRQMFVALEQQIVDMWEQDILCGLKLRIDYDHIVDNLANKEVGYSFISDPSNPFCHNKDILLRAILDSPEHRSRFICGVHPDGSPIWNKLAIKTWLLKYSEFDGLMLVRADMLGGAPGRGTEFTAMTYKNIPTTTHRSFMVFANYASALVTYHKGQSMTGLDKLIPHAFDAVTADLTIQSLSVGRPMRDLFAYIVNPTNATVHQVYRDHIFVNNGKLFTTTDMSNTMASLALPALNMKLGIQSWRQICIAWKRKLCTSIEDLIEEESLETIEARQSTHSRQTENRIYGLSADALSGVAEDVLPLYLDASTHWQIENKTVPGGLRLPYYEARAARFDELVKSGMITRPEKEITHPTAKNIEEMIARLLPTVAQPSTKSIEQAITRLLPTIVEQVSHSVVEKLMPYLSRQQGPATTQEENRPVAEEEGPLPPALIQQENRPVAEEALVPPAPTQEEEDDIDLAYEDPDRTFVQLSQPPVIEEDFHNVVEANIESFEMYNDHQLEALLLEQMRKMLKKPNAQWSCDEQRTGVIASARGTQDILAVLRTGGGKTMLAILPFLLETRNVTVVIVPLKSLISDYVRKLDHMGIRYEHYEGEKPKEVTGIHRLILVTVDQARTPHWEQTLGKIHDQRGIKRIIFDEGQAAITSDDFRAALRYLEELRSVATPIIVLSGTIPPKSQQAVIDAFGLKCSSLVLRTDTDRPELRYIFTKLRSALDIRNATKTLVETHAPQMEAKERILVFVPFRDEGRDIAKLLNCDFYHGQQELSDEERKKMYQRWISGEKRVMVCTSAFGAGNDYSHVRLVIHAGTPFEMIGFAQELGRGGRDGKPTECHILSRSGSTLHPKIAADPIDHKGGKVVFALLHNSNECIRYGITSYNDGHGTKCSDATQKCNRCVKIPPVVVQDVAGRSRPVVVQRIAGPSRPQNAPKFRPMQLSQNVASMLGKRKAVDPAQASFAAQAAAVKRKRAERFLGLGWMSTRAEGAGADKQL